MKAAIRTPERAPRARRRRALRRAFGAAALAALCAATPLAVHAQSGGAGTPQGFGVERFVEDSVLTARVKLALLDAPDVSALAIGVRTEGGVVQLSGFVDDERVAHRAREIASRVPGVLAVQDKLVIKAG